MAAMQVLAVVVFCLTSAVALAVPQVPCYFVFGDSLADPGNNNNLKTIAKANYAPYGVDFPGGPNPTGRFTNGRTYADFITQSLGFTSFVPPIAYAAVGNFIGVNYASGAAGILDDTGKTNGDRISLGKQILAHQRIVNQLPKSYESSAKYTPKAFAQLLVTEHNRLVKVRFSALIILTFVGVGHIGFTPYEFNLQWPGVQNATTLNNAVDLFNGALKASVDTLAKDLPEAKLTYLNTVGISSDGPAVPASAIRSCCQHIDTVSQITCKSGDSAVCLDRSKALFFDNIHTTEVVNQAMAARYYTAKNPSDASPYDIQKLASL